MIALRFLALLGVLSYQDSASVRRNFCSLTSARSLVSRLLLSTAYRVLRTLSPLPPPLMIRGAQCLGVSDCPSLPGEDLPHPTSHAAPKLDASECPAATI